MSNHILFIKNELYNIKILKQLKTEKIAFVHIQIKNYGNLFNLITFIINKKIITKEKI